MRLAVFFSAAVLLGCLSTSSHANDFFQVPVPSDAKEFARLDSKMPAVLSYFSQQSAIALRDFYVQQLGEPQSEQTVFGREQLYFNVNGQQVRIMISSRDDWQQVDIMVQN